MSDERLSDLKQLELYESFKNEQDRIFNGRLRWCIPLFVASGASFILPISAIVSGNPEYFMKFYETAPVVLPVLLISGAVSVFGMTRSIRNKSLQEIVVKIAEVEGRAIDNPDNELKRLDATTLLYSTLSLPQILNDGSQMMVQQMIWPLGHMEDKTFQEWEILSKSIVKNGNPDAVVHRSLGLADTWWSRVADNPEAPENHQQYARRFRSQIRNRAQRLKYPNS
jgi:hypothetical protein